MNKTVDLSNTYVEFIRILFAVVLTQSFVLVSSSEYSGWFLSIAAFSKNLLEVLTLFLSYVLVITSWIGYHVATNPIQGFPIRSRPRFFIDVALLFLYYLAFAVDLTFWLVLLVYGLVFTLYAAWDGFTAWEYKRHPKLLDRLTRRTYESIGLAVVFWAVYLLNIYETTSFPQIPYVIIFPMLFMIYFRKLYPKRNP
jgi:hypothetical protein